MNVTGNDDAGTANQEILIVSQRPISNVLSRSRVLFEVRDFVEPELGIASDAELVEPLLGFGCFRLRGIFEGFHQGGCRKSLLANDADFGIVSEEHRSHVQRIEASLLNRRRRFPQRLILRLQFCDLRLSSLQSLPVVPRIGRLNSQSRSL